MKFYGVITWKLLFSGKINLCTVVEINILFVGESAKWAVGVWGFPCWGGEWANFRLVGETFTPIRLVGKALVGGGGGTLLLPPMHLTLNLASEIDM